MARNNEEMHDSSACNSFISSDGVLELFNYTAKRIESSWRFLGDTTYLVNHFGVGIGLDLRSLCTLFLAI